MRHSAAWWAERVTEISERGGVRAVARRHGIEESTLKWWRWELRRRSREATGASTSPRLVDADQSLLTRVEIRTQRLTVSQKGIVGYSFQTETGGHSGQLHPHLLQDRDFGLRPQGQPRMVAMRACSVV